ncbi:hypothetical protein FSP39_017992 [Pinctada imbricata]|uniref:MYND-type domain-containing protein n=1 Tax=Pinctada imbricata TaxID=66713 RepID=A0AA89BXI0_PINIB|nr:hypothetical protein FSP39_017992 [Pinctada imbricata]
MERIAMAKNSLVAFWDNLNPMKKTTSQSNTGMKYNTEDDHECALSDKLDSIDILNREGDMQKCEDTDCYLCQKVGNNKRCSKCQKVWYCSKECQTKDWANHKKECKRSCQTTENVSTDDGKDSKSEDAENFTTGTLYGNCGFCHKRGALKSCGACKASHYCSRECQKLHWPSHKHTCCKTSSKGTSSTQDTKEKDKGKTGKGPKDITSQFNIPPGLEGVMRVMQFEKNDVPDTSHVFQVSINDWKRTRYNLARKFRNHAIYDTFAKTPFENDYVRGNKKSFVLCFMPRPHVYFPRHCIYIQDVTGSELYIAFYLDDDDPSPYFTWDDVRPGRFICIENGRLRHFISGDTGIRIEEACNVSFIDLKLH